MANKASLLKDGKIPANTVCPFRVRCDYADRNECYHFGYNHSEAFSCGTARAFDITTPERIKTHGYVVIVNSGTYSG